jgi:hypothetical protein
MVLKLLDLPWVLFFFGAQVSTNEDVVIYQQIVMSLKSFQKLLRVFLNEKDIGVQFVESIRENFDFFSLVQKSCLIKMRNLVSKDFRIIFYGFFKV